MTDIAAAEPTTTDLEPEGSQDLGTGGEATATEATSTPEVFADFDTYADRVVPITVDGEEVMVPLSELRDGHLRQRDYTQKTQDLAVQRRELAQAEALYNAFQEDPAGTLEVLQGVVSQQAPPAVDEFATEEEQRLARVESFIEQQQRTAQESAVQAQLDGLVQQHGVNPDELIAFAIQHQIPNLDWAYAVMATTTQQVQQQVTDQAAAAEAARTTAKEQAQVVHEGAGRNPAAATAPTTGHSSISASWEAAKQQLGIG